VIGGGEIELVDEADVGDPEARPEIERAVVEVRLLQLGGDALGAVEIGIAIAQALPALRERSDW
jgi:hypothetical protein